MSSKVSGLKQCKKRIAELHDKMVPVPNNMTHVFQPLDLTVNRS